MCAAPSEFEYDETDNDAGGAPAPRRDRKTMIVGRVIGWTLLTLGLIILAWDIKGWVDEGALVFVTAGELWFTLHDGSLNLLQAVTQRYVLPELWDPIFVTVLLWPAFLVIGVPGLVLAWTCRRRSAPGGCDLQGRAASCWRDP